MLLGFRLFFSFNEWPRWHRNYVKIGLPICFAFIAFEIAFDHPGSVLSGFDDSWFFYLAYMTFAISWIVCCWWGICIGFSQLRLFVKWWLSGARLAR